MRHAARHVLLLAALATAVHAQTAPTAAPAPASSVPGAEKAVPDQTPAPRRNRVLSPEAAAALAAAAPKYAPPPKEPERKPEEELPDLRETDKPKNTIVRLPKFVVQEPRPPVFREKDILSKVGLEKLAMRRYLTEADRALNRFRLPLFSAFSTNGGSGSNEDRAMAMYYEDERLKNMSDVADRTNMVMKSDSTAGAKMKNESQQTFMRWTDFGWNGGSKK